MAEEAAVNVVMRMRDEASAGLTGVGQTMAQTEVQALQLNVALTAIGGAFTAMGSLISQIDDPMAKLAGTFMTTAGAMLMTVSAIIAMMPQIRNLITWLRSLAVVQAVVQALAGPPGWIALGAGLAIAAAGTAAVIGMTGGFSGGNRGGTTVNINAGVLMGDSMQAKELARMVKSSIDEDQRFGR